MAKAPVVTAIGVQNVATLDLEPNPHNPRMLFDRVDMTPLQESIARVGILVPLTVYKEKRTNRYIILDGQRRWLCAQAVRLAKVPVNVVTEPTLVENIVTMFQIHKLRKDWELMPTALKLELLMTEVGDRSDRRIAALTGLDQSIVVRCKKLLSFPKRYQDMMLDINPEKRVKADFFIELHSVNHDRTVQKFDWFKPNPFTDAMLKKHADGYLKSVTEFRVVKQHITAATKANRISTISRRLREFAEQVDLPAAHLEIQSAVSASSARKIIKSSTALYDEIEAITVEDFYGETLMWERLEMLLMLIRQKLKEVDRRIDQ